MTSSFSPEALITSCDRAFNSVGNWGYLTLLSGQRLSSTAVVNATANYLNTSKVHGLVNGARVSFTATVLPAPLVALTDYYVTVISPTVIKLATTLVEALSNVFIDVTTAGSPDLVINESPLLATDPLSVLINKEVVHSAWLSRAPISNLGAATMVNGAALKPPTIVTLVNSTTTALVYQQVLLIQSTSTTAAVIGNIPSSGFILVDPNALQTVGANAIPTVLSIVLEASN